MVDVVAKIFDVENENLIAERCKEARSGRSSDLRKFIGRPTLTKFIDSSATLHNTTLHNMAKDTERKRKLEQDQAEVTPKRLKPTNSDSTGKKANGVNGKAASKTGNASPQVVIQRTQDAVSGADGTTATVKEDGLTRKERKEQREAGLDKSATPRPEKTKPGAPKFVKKKKPTTPKEPKDKSMTVTKEQKENKTATAKVKDGKADKQLQKRLSKGSIFDASENGSINLSQRNLGKKDRRKIEREVRAGLRHDENKTSPNENGWWLTPPAAGRYLDHDPIFVRDEQMEDCLIAASVREVQLLSLDTSLVVRSHVVPDGHSVACYSLSPNAPDCVDIAYDNGTKVQWNWITSELVKGTFPGQDPIIAMTTSSTPSAASETFYITCSAGTREYNVVGEGKAMYSTSSPLLSIQVLKAAAYIVCVSPNAVILGARKSQTPESDYTWIEMPVAEPINCADARLVMAKKQGNQRPGLALAVGNIEGQIHLYSNLTALFANTPDAARIPPPQILHWHRDSVSALKFSNDGNYLISGGKETVLVLWQLETGKQQFLPHLTAEVERIVVAPNGTQYALQMGDNSIMVISTTELKPIANFAGLQLPIRVESADDYITLPKTTAVIDPSSPNHLLLTVPASQPKTFADITTRPFLQTFDIRTSRHVSRQALTRNNVTDFSLGPEKTVIDPPDVNLLALSADGKWMASVDEWIPPATDLSHTVGRTTGEERDVHDLLEAKQQQERRREVYLKFWRWDADQELWTLSTRADAPHARSAGADAGSGAGRVLALKADSSSGCFATLGEDGVVKFWRMRTRMRQGVPIKDENGQIVVEWICKHSVPLHIAVEIPAGRADSALDFDEDDEVKEPESDAMELVEEQEDTMPYVPDRLVEQDQSLFILDATLSFSPDGSLLAVGTVSGATSEPSPLIHFISTTTGEITATKTGISAPDEELLATAFLDRYFIALSQHAVRVWNLIDDSHHYTLALPSGGNEEQDDAILAVNDTDETFAVVSSKVDQGTHTLEIYSAIQPHCLFEVEFETRPAAVLAAKGSKGFVVVFEDGSIRKVVSSSTTSRSAFLDIVGKHAEDQETAFAVAATPAVIESAVSLLQPSDESAEEDEIVSNGLLGLELGDEEDDRPVVRPEQLAGIFDTGLPPVGDMFRAVVGLYGRKPRARELVEV